MMAVEPLLEVDDLSQRFGGLMAVDNVACASRRENSTASSGRTGPVRAPSLT